MTDSGGQTANGTKVVLSACDGSRAQHWTIEPDGTVRIFGKCLTLRSDAFPGVPAVLWSCGNVAYLQRWPIPLSDDLGVAIAGETGGFLGVPAGKTANGTQLATVGNAGTVGTHWHVW
jgi:ricin-type beta-trefoil lectin protein